MSDGPWKSLPMRPHWKQVARRAETGAFSQDELSDAFQAALLKDAEDLPVEAVCRAVIPEDQGILFRPDLNRQFEDLRRDHPGSKPVDTLVTSLRDPESVESSMDDLAEMADGGARRRIVRRHAASLRRVLRHTGDAEERLIRLLERHADEWQGYLNSLGAGSFVQNWIRG